MAFDSVRVICERVETMASKSHGKIIIDKNGKKIFIWKRKHITEAVLNKRLSQVESGKKRRKISDGERSGSSDKVNDNLQIVHGRRFIDINTLGENLICTNCNETLSLSNIVDERRVGLASVLTIKCVKCISMNTVETDKRHMSNCGKQLFNINTEAALGVVHSGMGYTHLNKLLACVDVPTIDSKMFKRHEREVGTAVENIAKENCKKWAEVERDLTIQNVHKLKNLLPSELQSGFIIKKKDDNDANPQMFNNNIGESTFREDTEQTRNLSPEREVSLDDVVRVVGSYDMGWSTRGNGKSYDSLNGYASFIGLYTGRVLEYETKNRKCRMCDKGHPRDDHDCRLNFTGSAKAMEPSAAVKITTQSPIFNDLNIEVGVLIGDDDSSTISAVRHASQHQVVKHSDKNHTSRGVTKQLYNMKKDYRDITKESIAKLHRCFTYAMAQNKEKSETMAAAIRNIPYHCFNFHDNCGNWCKYRQDPTSYKPHKNFQNPQLFEDLKIVFDKLASKVDRFASGASSQGNESLNAIMASKAPKARCYSQSESGDYRYACAVNQKNIGEKYIEVTKDKLGLALGLNTHNHVNRIEKTAKFRAEKVQKPEFKRKRLFLKKNKTMLRNKKEASEGETYNSNMGFLSTSAVDQNRCPIDPTSFDEEPCVVFFDLETSGFSKNANTLQIAAKCENSCFSVYIHPTRQITPQASEATGLTSFEGNLMLNGVRVNSKPLVIAFTEFLYYLRDLKRRCILCAHNCNFDVPRVLRAINILSMSQDFSCIIQGFADTLQIIKRLTGKKGKGENTLTGLATLLEIAVDGAHNAIHDVNMLEKITEKLKISKQKIIADSQSWDFWINKQKRQEQSNVTLQTLLPLRNCLSLQMRKKMANADISYDVIVDTFRTQQEVGIKRLLGIDENGIVRVTKSSKIIKNIVEFMKKEFNNK